MLNKKYTMEDVDDEIKELEKYANLSFSNKSELLEFFNYKLKIDGIYPQKAIKDLDIKYTQDKNKNKIELFKKIRNMRKPIMTEYMNKIKNISNKLKSKNIQLIYPENLEGDSVELKIKIMTENDLENLKNFFHLEGDTLIKLLKLIKMEDVLNEK